MSIDFWLKNNGFVVFDVIKGSDMGQSSYELPQYKNSKCKVVGGYWEWKIIDLSTDKEVFKGWWETLVELKEFEYKMNKFNLI